MISASAVDITTADSALYANVAWLVAPTNGMYFSNNVFGKGSFVNGVDYIQKLTTRAGSFPDGAVMEWSWPDATSGAGFAYSYPYIIYGGGYYGDGWNQFYTDPHPWPMKINNLTTLTCSYDLTLYGNTTAYDMLIDMFVTASSSSVDGSYVAEISFFPYLNSDLLMAGITSTVVHTFSFGEAKVGIQGTQICVFPTSGGGATRRSILSGTINLKEICQYVASLGLGGLTGDEYVRGIQIGPEVQVPGAHNTTPHKGAVRFNTLSFAWT